MHLQDCSLLIQGPLHQHSIINLDYVKDVFGEIIYSTYPIDDNLYDFVQFKGLSNSADLIINEVDRKHVLPDNVALSQQNFEKQVLSTFNGLKKCTKKYVLKMRSDEYYLGLKNLPDYTDDTKVNFVNIFFRHFDQFPYHISDHMFVAERNLLHNSFSMLYNACYLDFEKFVQTTCRSRNINVQLFAEQAICLSLLYNIVGQKIPFHNKKINVFFFQEYFHIFTAKSIGPYCVSTSRPNHNGKQFVTNIEHSHLKLKTDCNSIGQYK